jgi:quercetin dioxygenase-like cupin family protein
MKETDQTTLPIVEMAKSNVMYRKVVVTGEKAQVVLMAIPQGEDIGAETHEGHDQVLSCRRCSATTSSISPTPSSRRRTKRVK